MARLVKALRNIPPVALTRQKGPEEKNSGILQKFRIAKEQPLLAFASRAREPERVQQGARCIRDHSDSRILDELEARLIGIYLKRLARFEPDTRVTTFFRDKLDSALFYCVTSFSSGCGRPPMGHRSFPNGRLSVRKRPIP